MNTLTLCFMSSSKVEKKTQSKTEYGGRLICSLGSNISCLLLGKNNEIKRLHCVVRCCLSLEAEISVVCLYHIVFGILTFVYTLSDSFKFLSFCSRQASVYCFFFEDAQFHLSVGRPFFICRPSFFLF